MSQSRGATNRSDLRFDADIERQRQETVGETRDRSWIFFTFVGCYLLVGVIILIVLAALGKA